MLYIEALAKTKTIYELRLQKETGHHIASEGANVTDKKHVTQRHQKSNFKDD